MQLKPMKGGLQIDRIYENFWGKFHKIPSSKRQLTNWFTSVFPNFAVGDELPSKQGLKLSPGRDLAARLRYALGSDPSVPSG